MGPSAPRILVAAGLEPSGRVGLFADLSTVTALGGVGLGVATVLTAQGRRTFGSQAVPSRALAAQVRALGELGKVDAVKLGALSSPRQLELLWALLAKRGRPWVVDPVVLTSRGERLG